MFKIKRVLSLHIVKIIIYFSAGLLIVTYASTTINYYTTPKVYTILQQKGRLDNNSKLYDCIIPKNILVDGNKIYLAYSWQSVTGKKYAVISRNVTVLDADDYKYAVQIQDIIDDWLIVVAYDGELTENGDVIILRS